MSRTSSSSEDYDNKVFEKERKSSSASSRDVKGKKLPSPSAAESFSSDSFFDFDVILKEIGDLGIYQLALVAMVYWITLPAGMTQVASVFLAAVPTHRCKLPPLDDASKYNLTEAELAALVIPTNTIKNAPDSCSRYAYDLSTCTPPSLSCVEPSPPPANFSTMDCDKGYYYDDSTYISTVTTEWNLVCDDTIIGTCVTAIYFAGVLFSSIFGGNIVDRFGRKPVMLGSQIAMIALGIGCSYSPTLIGFTALRFSIALFLQAGFIACFVYVVEIVGEKWRTLIGIFVQLFFALGYMCLSGFAYLWRDWRDLQFAISFVPVPFLIFYFFIPESPRWLFDQNKNKEAIQVCEKMVKKNGNTFTEDVWERSMKSGSKLRDNANSQKSYSPMELFRRPRMRLITINMMFNWFVNSLVYYGLSLNAGELAGTPFLNNTLNGLVEFGAFFVIVLTMDRLGRRYLLCGCLLLGGFGCLASTVTKHYATTDAMVNLATAFALIGKMAVSGSFAIAYNFTAELYPTVVRSTAVGLGSMAARVGSIITPFTLQLQDTIPWLTSVIFGVFAIVAGLLSLLFPETAGKQLPTSLEETEAFFRGETLLEANEVVQLLPVDNKQNR